MNNINPVVVPGYIGCDCGGGVWGFYRSELFKIAHELTSIKPHIEVKIVTSGRTNLQILVSLSIAL